jgi:hypothetical protein
MVRTAKTPPPYQIRYYFSGTPPEGFKRKGRISCAGQDTARHDAARLAGRGARTEVWSTPATGAPARIAEYTAATGVPCGSAEGDTGG